MKRARLQHQKTQALATGIPIDSEFSDSGKSPRKRQLGQKQSNAMKKTKIDVSPAPAAAAVAQPQPVKPDVVSSSSSPKHDKASTNKYKVSAKDDTKNKLNTKYDKYRQNKKQKKVTTIIEDEESDADSKKAKSNTGKNGSGAGSTKLVPPPITAVNIPKPPPPPPAPTIKPTVTNPSTSNLKPPPIVSPPPPPPMKTSNNTATTVPIKPVVNAPPAPPAPPAAPPAPPAPPARAPLAPKQAVVDPRNALFDGIKKSKLKKTWMSALEKENSAVHNRLTTATKKKLVHASPILQSTRIAAVNSNKTQVNAQAPTISITDQLNQAILNRRLKRQDTASSTGSTVWGD